jgi:hypothetical protein
METSIVKISKDMVPNIVQNLLRFVVVFSITCQFKVNKIITAAAIVTYY